MKLNADFNGILIQDELHNVGPLEFALDHDTIMDDGFTIYTGVNQTGEELVPGTDYELLNEDTRLSAQTDGKHVYTKVRILNEDYHGINLYITYKTVGDYAVAEDINAAIEKVRTPQLKVDLTNPEMVPTWPFIMNHTKNHVIEFPPLMSVQAVFVRGNYLYIALKEKNSSSSTILKVDSTTFEVVNTTTLPHEVVEMDGGSRGLICAGPTISLLDIDTLEKKSTTLGSDVGVFCFNGWDIYAVRSPNSYRLIRVEDGALEFQGSYTINEASEITALNFVYINVAEGSRLIVGTEDGELMSIRLPRFPTQTINIIHPPKKLIDAGPDALVAYCKDNKVRCYSPNLTNGTDYVNFSCSGQLEWDYSRESFYILEGTTLRRKATKSSTIIASTQVATESSDPTSLKMYCYHDDIYVVNSTTVEVYDADDLSLKRRGNYHRDTWTLGVEEAYAVCCDDKYVYVGVRPSSIIKIDAYTKEPVLRVDTDQFHNYGPTYMFRLGNYLFIANYSTSNYLGLIIKYDTETLTEVGRLGYFGMVGVTADHDYLYCLMGENATFNPNTLIIIDPTTMEEIQSIDLWTNVSKFFDNTPLIICGKDKLVFEGMVGPDWSVRLIWIDRGYLPPYIQRSIIVSDFSSSSFDAYPTGTIFFQDNRFFSISKSSNVSTIERVGAYGKTEMLTFSSNGFFNLLATTDGKYVYFVGRRNDPPALRVIKYDPIKNKIMKKTVQGALEPKAVAANGRQLIILCNDKNSDQVKLLFLNDRMEE